MKTKITLALALIITFSFTGCTSNKEAREETESNLQNPEVVGKVKGQILYRAEIINAVDHNHWVYWFDSNPVVTVNREVPNGKGSQNITEVILDGKRYIPAEKE